MICLLLYILRGDREEIEHIKHKDCFTGMGSYLRGCFMEG